VTRTVLQRLATNDDRRQQRRRQRTWYRRSVLGLRPTQIEYSAAVVTMLISTQWLAEADADDKRAVGAAVSAFLADAAKSF